MAQRESTDDMYSLLKRRFDCSERAALVRRKFEVLTVGRVSYLIQSIVSEEQDTFKERFNRPITFEQAKELASRLLTGDFGGGDGQIHALIELIVGIAYEEDHVERERLAMSAIREAFFFSEAHDEALNQFFHCGPKQ
jgi:hypothetical protein